MWILFHWRFPLSRILFYLFSLHSENESTYVTSVHPRRNERDTYGCVLRAFTNSGEGGLFAAHERMLTKDLDQRGWQVNSKPGSDATTAFIDVWRYTAASLVHGGVADQRALRMRTCVGDSELRASEQKQLSWVGFNWKFTITLGFWR